jgi:hypothetical protein
MVVQKQAGSPGRQTVPETAISTHPTVHEATTVHV